MAASRRFIPVARVEEVPAGTSKTVRAGDRTVVLANWAGNIYCFANLCPHRQNSLEGARVWDGMLECPWHHFLYDLRTGENRYPSNVFPRDDPRCLEQLHLLHRYTARVVEGQIVVCLTEEPDGEGGPV